MRIMAENIEQLEERMDDSRGRALQDRYHSQWIARWTRSNSKPVCQSHQQYAVSYASKEEVHAKEKGHLEGKTPEPRKIKILKIDRNEESTHERNNLCRSDPSKINLSVKVHQSAEPMGTEVGGCELISNLMVQKQVKLHHTEVVSTGTCYLHEIPDSNVNLKKDERSRALKNLSECNNLLMVDSNKKTDRLLTSLDNFGTIKSSKEGLSLWRSPLASRDLAYVYELFRKMPSSSILDVDLLKMNNASSSMENTRGGALEFPNVAQSFFMTKMCMDSSGLEQLTVDLAESTKAKGIALFEMLTVASLEGKGTQGTKCLQEANSIQGASSNGPKKGIWCSKVGKNQLPSFSLVEQATRRDTETVRQLPYPVYTDEAKVNSDIRISRSEYKNTKPDTSVQRPCVLNSSSIVENSFQADSCSRWLKRLSRKPLDSPAIVSKKYKTGDGPSSGEECCFLRKEINYKIPNYLKGKQVLYDNMKLTKRTGCSLGLSAETLSSWIQRWSHNNNRITQAQLRLAGPVLSKPENSYIIDDNSEGKQFPSIAALALMGRLMKQFRSCVFHRRGCSVVWNIEDW